MWAGEGGDWQTKCLETFLIATKEEGGLFPTGI